MMKIIFGIATVNSGVCIGKIKIESDIFQSSIATNACGFVDGGVVSAWENYNSALICLKQKLVDELQNCKDENHRDIIECQLMVLEDEELEEEVRTVLADATTDATSVVNAYTIYAKRIFGESVQGLFVFRAEDLICLGQMIADLMRQESYHPNEEEQIIVFCDHVCLSHILLQSNIVGIIEKAHIIFTHASLLLKAQGLPAVEGIQPEESWQGKKAILDADRGCLIIEPSDQVIYDYRKRSMSEHLINKASLIVPYGTKVLATINSTKEAMLLSGITDVSINVGLIRTEMLFLNCFELPNEDEQYRLYLYISDLLPGRMLTFRSFDFGGDKYDVMPEKWKLCGISRNQKGVLATLEAEDDFKHQMRAIIRLSRQRNVRLLFPYITESAQLSQVSDLLDSIYGEDEFVGCTPIEKGFMIENTASLNISDEIISASDFVTVGTNDLLKSIFPSVHTQGDDSLCDEEWSVFAGVIRNLVISAHAEHKKLILCGNVAQNRNLVPLLDKAGIDYVSVMVSSLESDGQRRNL